jgi:acyl dehydratase
MGFVDFLPCYPKPRARHRLHGADFVSDRYYEDFKVGDRFVSGGMTMTEAGIIDFARQWDPQPFHIDVEFAKKWSFDGLIASGLHTMAVTLKLWLEQGVFRACSLGTPGIGEVQFPRPVRPADTLRVVTDIVELRLSSSKPDRGIARIRQVTINQRGEQVMEQETTVFLKRRPMLAANFSARS